MRCLPGMVVTAALVATMPAVAQDIVAVPRDPASIGLHANWAEDADFGLGARYDHVLNHIVRGMSPKVNIIITLDYFFPRDPIDSYVEGNVNLSYQFGDMRRSIGPYFGAGLNIARVEAGAFRNTDLGLNVLGGIRFRSASRTVPYLEARFEAGGGEQFVITGGILLF